MSQLSKKQSWEACGVAEGGPKPQGVKIVFGLAWAWFYIFTFCYLHFDIWPYLLFKWLLTGHLKPVQGSQCFSNLQKLQLGQEALDYSVWHESHSEVSYCFFWQRVNIFLICSQLASFLQKMVSAFTCKSNHQLPLERKRLKHHTHTLPTDDFRRLMGPLSRRVSFPVYCWLSGPLALGCTGTHQRHLPGRRKSAGDNRQAGLFFFWDFWSWFFIFIDFFRVVLCFLFVVMGFPMFS